MFSPGYDPPANKTTYKNRLCASKVLFLLNLLTKNASSNIMFSEPWDVKVEFLTSQGFGSHTENLNRCWNFIDLQTKRMEINPTGLCRQVVERCLLIFFPSILSSLIAIGMGLVPSRGPGSTRYRVGGQLVFGSEPVLVTNRFPMHFVFALRSPPGSFSAPSWTPESSKNHSKINARALLCPDAIFCQLWDRLLPKCSITWTMKILIFMRELQCVSEK